jgi:acyl-CoA thioesterase FadM
MRKPRTFRTEHQVTYSQIDAYGHMGSAHYLALFIDHHLRETLNALHEDLSRYVGRQHQGWVRKVEIEYNRPLKLGAKVVIGSQMTEWTDQTIAATCYMFKVKVVDGKLIVGDVDFETCPFEEMHKLKPISTCTFLFSCVDTSGTDHKWPDEFKNSFFVEDAESSR